MILIERRGIRALPARFVLRAVRRFQRSWWWLIRPRTTGVRAICLTSEGRLVLVRHSYITGWFLPGGGPRGAEAALPALLRELAEEIGLVAHAQPELLFTLEQRADHKRDRQTIYLVGDARIQPRLSLEIEAVGVFPLDCLPECHPSTRYKLDRWRGGRTGPAPHED